MKADYTLGLVLYVALAGPLFPQSQGTTPRAKPTEYPSQAKVAHAELAAEYLVHSIPSSNGMIFTDDFLVIEVAVYPALKTGFGLHDGDFTLRVNGKKVALLPQSPGMVASSLKYPDWQMRPHLEAEAGAGDGSVIFGRPNPVGRFPGDPTGTRRVPLPRAPEPENPAGEPAPPPVPIEILCQQIALPEGTVTGPASGYLFFPFKGKTKSIKSLELLYENQGGEKATLQLL